MISKTVTSLAFAAACLTVVAAAPGAQALTQLVTNGPQVSPGDNSTSWSAHQNILQSRRYERLLEASAGFRHARMRKECGPITDAQLHANCLASFSQDEPAYGSSTPPYRYHSGAGR